MLVACPQNSVRSHRERSRKCVGCMRTVRCQAAAAAMQRRWWMPDECVEGWRSGHDSTPVSDDDTSPSPWSPHLPATIVSFSNQCCDVKLEHDYNAACYRSTIHSLSEGSVSKGEKLTACLNFPGRAAILKSRHTTLDIQTKTMCRLWWPQMKRQTRWAVGRGSSSHSSLNLFSHSVELFSSISCICKQSIRDKSNYWQQTLSELRSWTCVWLNFNGLLSTSSSQVCSDPWHVCGMHISAVSNRFYPTVEAGSDQTKFQAVAQLLGGGCVFLYYL